MITNHLGDSVSGPEKAGVGGSIPSLATNIFNNLALALPKVAVLRSFVMNHTIHHRAQLGVYLRLNDIPVPSIYGPSADEGGF